MFIIVILLNGIIVFHACKKDTVIDDPKEFDTQTSQDNSLAEGIFNDVNNIVGEALENGSNGLSTYKLGATHNTLLSTCATVTVNPDSSGNGGTIVVDFDTTNCLCSDYRFRRGKINIAYSGHYRDSGTVITTTFDNYYVGRFITQMYKVTGTKSVTNNGTNTSGNLNYSIVVNGHLLNPNGAPMDWTSSRNREWIAGESTALDWTDDIYLIRGSASGTNFEGNSFTANIVSPLQIELSCFQITKGIFELTPSGKPTRSLDYGNGACDDDAVVTVNGTSFAIKLR